MRKMCLVLLALLLVHSVFALSISPARQFVHDAGTHDFIITIIPGGSSGTLQLSSTGDLAQYISFNQTQVNLSQNTVISGTITVPEDIVPGDHEQRIIATLTSSTTDMVSASVEVVSLLVVRKEFEGPYLVATVFSSPDKATNNTMVYITLENRGNTPITPQVTLERRRTETLLSKEVSPNNPITLSKLLQGFGQEEITLHVKGANEISQKFTVIFGHPTITSFTAEHISETGTIRPILVSATVDWNMPVQAAVKIGDKTTLMNISNEFEQMFYTETTENTIPVTLQIGEEQRTIIVDFTKPKSSGSYLWVIIIICALGISAALLLYFHKRS